MVTPGWGDASGFSTGYSYWLVCPNRECGSNVFFEWDRFSKTLRIYGKGPTYTYPETWGSPFVFLDAKYVHIEEGVTGLGNYLFAASDASTGYNNVVKLELASSVKSIGTGAFQRQNKLKNIVFKEGLKTIRNLAFYQTGLVSISIPESVESIGDSAFHTAFFGLNPVVILRNPDISITESNVFSTRAGAAWSNLTIYRDGREYDPPLRVLMKVESGWVFIDMYRYYDQK